MTGDNGYTDIFLLGRFVSVGSQEFFINFEVSSSPRMVICVCAPQFWASCGFSIDTSAIYGLYLARRQTVDKKGALSVSYGLKTYEYFKKIAEE